MNFSAEVADWKSFKENNKAISFNILFLPANREEIK